MPLFQLTMQPTPQCAPETLQFIAGDVANAITFANRYTSTIPAELWSDGRRVCRLEYDEPTGSWVVADQAEKIAGEGEV